MLNGENTIKTIAILLSKSTMHILLKNLYQTILL